MTGPVVVALVAIVVACLVAAFLIVEGEWEKYVQWRELHMPMWERDEARRRALRCLAPRPGVPLGKLSGRIRRGARSITAARC